MKIENLKLTLRRPSVNVNLNECPCNWTYQVTSGPVRGTLTEVDSLSSWFITVRRVMGASF